MTFQNLIEPAVYLPDVKDYELLRIQRTITECVSHAVKCKCFYVADYQIELWSVVLDEFTRRYYERYGDKSVDPED